MLRFISSVRGAFIAAVSVTLFAHGSRAATPSHTIPGLEYTALRRQKHYDSTLTYAQIQTDPTKYAGKVLEMAGKVDGSSSDGVTASVVLALGEQVSVSIDLPVAALDDIRSDPTGRIRVLVQVADPGNSNLAALKVLGYAHEGDVRQLELDAATREKAHQAAIDQQRKSEERWRKEAQRVVHYGHEPPIIAASSSGAGSGMYADRLSPRARPLFWPYFNFIAQENQRLDSAAVATITFHLLNFADRYNVDPRLVVSMIMAESHFNPNATSRSGAMGLGQLMPGTAKALGVDNPYDPVQNLDGCINYLRSRLDTFADKALPGGGMSFEQVALAMAAYNAGANAVKKYNGIPPYTQTQNYVKKVIEMYQKLCR